MKRWQRFASTGISAACALAFAACSGASPSSISTSPPNEGTAADAGGEGASSGSNGGNGGQTPLEDGGTAQLGSSSGGDAGGSPGSSGSSGDAGADAATATGAGIDYAPYFPTWVWGGSGYAFTSLTDLQKKAGLNEVTIAFVLSNGGCNTTQDIEQNLSDVKAFIAAGGHVKASFGGADGTYVESACKDAASLATAIGDFVDATGITDLDFDVEQGPAETDAVNAMRGQALKTVQDAKKIKVAFTLPANPSPGGGLDGSGTSVVSNALSAGVVISHVNFMTMDYGDGFGGKPLAPVVTGTLDDGHAQIMSLVAGITSDDAWKMVGVIPMIGKNDDSEVFSLDDARTLAQFATTNHLGLVSFWSIDRDQVCPSGADYNSCSTVDTANFAFNAILMATAK